MTKITIADTQATHPLLSAPYIGELMTQFDIALSQSTQDKPMTLTEIAQTFPPMWAWSREQEQTVAKAIQAIVGQTYICNHPNMNGVETTVVEQHPHSRGTTLFLHSPSRADQSVVNHECDVFHFVEFYTLKPQDEPMPIDMTFQEFLKDFAYDEGKALYYIDNILAEGRIEVSEKTLPYYTWNESALPPRWIAYADHQPQTHSFEMRIKGWYEDDDSSADAIVTFDRSDNGLNWFFSNLYRELDGIIEESEMHWQDTPQNHRKREREALLLQRDSYRRRIDKTRIYLIDSGAVMSPDQFEQNCKDIVDLLNKVKFASERIQHLLA
mgnify:FL=1